MVGIYLFRDNQDLRAGCLLLLINEDVIDRDHRLEAKLDLGPDDRIFDDRKARFGKPLRFPQKFAGEIQAKC